MANEGLIPTAGDGCGNHYILATRGDFGAGFPVLFIDCSVDHESPAFIVASDIGRFLEFLLGKELGVAGWPFDKASVLHADPNIRRFQGVALPWDAG